ncbi:hypothetical protein BD770DRAFT_393364 [Pilaira anomala]|nr:hypothetical protein BD770DRAFT_393364 [Pilaira anomala]
MSTLKAFGFAPRRKGEKVSASSKAIDFKPSIAFIQPVDYITPKRVSKKSIEHYFQQKEEEPPVIIRKKLPLLNVWNQVEQDSVIDEFKETYSNKRRRIREEDSYVKRQRTLAQDLSNAIRYLNIHTHNTNVRCKMNREKSNMLISNMTQDFLY